MSVAVNHAVAGLERKRDSVDAGPGSLEPLAKSARTFAQVEQEKAHPASPLVVEACIAAVGGSERGLAFEVELFERG